ncbi:hypothetical protein H1P_6630003 [Hyella patelloides LEGE 07179]|uniref:Uncharacterized protein n=1 Tax=Hyella patelloides LEGE 07179 TaxID=945734 RepID=A0A563W2N9_9CYAN|nr:hypothetical protein [Hyella patelloides]VEP17962.1 hypothetical protein H1P_6630003 [Hyella patelloides LEGE 07179]
MKTVCREIKCPYWKEKSSQCTRYSISASVCHIIRDPEFSASNLLTTEYAIHGEDAFDFVGLKNQHDCWLKKDLRYQRDLELKQKVTWADSLLPNLTIDAI